MAWDPSEPFQYPILVVNYAHIHPGAKSLVILMQSPVTDYLEANPEIAWDFMRPMLERIKVRPIQNPLNVIVSDWTQNPFARGSYSTVHSGDDPLAQVEELSGESDAGLGENSTIRFAGEHTILDGMGYVHGAYNSGTRAGLWISQHLAEHGQTSHL